MTTEPHTPPAEAPEAEAPDTATETTNTPEVLAAELAKARKEAARYRERLRAEEEKRTTAEAERLKAAPLEERLKALEAEREALTKKATDAEAARRNAERIAALTGKVADPKAALRLLDDDDVDEDGNVNLDALLTRYPFLAPAQAGARPAATSGSGTTARPPTHTQRIQELLKSPRQEDKAKAAAILAGDMIGR